MVNTAQYTYAFKEPRNIPLIELKRRDFYHQEASTLIELLDTSSESILPDFDEARKCLKIIQEVKQLIRLDASSWATDLDIWNDLVELIRECWGDRWICFHFANIASGIRSSEQKCLEYSNLFDASKELCKRVRYARLRAGQHQWWESQIALVSNDNEKKLILLVAFTWASSKTLNRIIYRLDDLISDIDDLAWKKLYESVEEVIRLKKFPPHNALKLSNFSASLHPRTTILISLKADTNFRKKLYLDHLKHYDGEDDLVLEICQSISLELLANDYSIWSEVRDVIQKSYSRGIVSEPYAFHRLSRKITTNSIPKDIAEEIASNPNNYPGFLVAIAERKMKERVASEVVPVGEIAVRDKWFTHL